MQRVEKLADVVETIARVVPVHGLPDVRSAVTRGHPDVRNANLLLYDLGPPLSTYPLYTL